MAARLFGWILFASVIGSLVIPMASEQVRANPGWGTTTLLETNNSGDAMFPEIAMNEDGNAIAIWMQSDGVLNDIYANQFTVGMGWGTAELIENESSGSGYLPDVAIDSEGNGIAVWSQYNGTLLFVWTNRYTPGIGWGIPQRISLNPLGLASNPQVVCDAHGNAFAIWIEYTRIFASRYVASVGWGAAEAVESHLDNPQPPSIGVDAEGNAIVVWSENTTTTYNIWANRYVVGSGWGSEILIETNDTGDAFEPRIVVDDPGNAVVVWHQMDGPYSTWGPNHIWANRYVADAGWGVARLIETDNGGSAWNPRVAVDNHGNAIAAWYSVDLGASSVWTNKYSIANGWSTAEQLYPGNIKYAFSPEIAMDKFGRALMVWLGDMVYSSRCRPSTVWKPAEIVTSYSVSWGGIQGQRVAVDGNGNGVAVWFMNDTERFSIYANDFIPPVPKLTITSPVEGMIRNEQFVAVSGVTDPGVQLVVNDISVSTQPDGSFSATIVLVNGSNTIEVTATNDDGKTVTITRTVWYVNPESGLQDELNRTKHDLRSAEEMEVILGVALGTAVVIASISIILYWAQRRRIAQEPDWTGEIKPPLRPS